MFGINGWELIVLAVIAVFVLGPERLPEYAAKLAHGIRRLRVLAEGAKDQLKDQLGPEYNDIDWRQYDPRQYDPRRIVRQALLDPLDDAVAPVREELGSVRSAARLGADGSGSPAGSGDAGAVGEAPEPRSSSDGLRPAMAGAAAAGLGMQPPPMGRPNEFDPGRATPYDTDAT
jgi:sec-independent protein translocase protein TatB